MSEGFFRYVELSRVYAYAALGWREIGSTVSPHDAEPVIVMEWPGRSAPLEPRSVESFVIAKAKP